MHIKFKLPKKISSNKAYAGQHWAVRKAQADLYHDYLNAIVKEEQVSPIKQYPIDIEYIFTFKSRPLDTTNCFYMAKLAEDGLVKAGILENDDPEHVQYTGVYSQKGEEDSLEITIT